MSVRRFSEAAFRRILGRALTAEESGAYSEHEVRSAARDVGIRSEAVDVAIAAEASVPGRKGELSALTASGVLYVAAGFGVGAAVNASWWTPMETSSAFQIGVFSLSAVAAGTVATLRGRGEQLAFQLKNAVLWGSFGVATAIADHSPGIPFLSLSGMALGFGVISALVGGAALLLSNRIRNAGPKPSE